MTDKEVIAQISKRRRQCIIHRYLYYVLSEPLISDYQYDMIERDLRSLVDLYPTQASQAEYNSYCPTRNVGSSNLEDYPRALTQIADELLATAQKAAVSPSRCGSHPMTVRRLIAMLLHANLDDKVEAFDPDLESWEEITGMVYGNGSVQLYTDDIS